MRPRHRPGDGLDSALGAGVIVLGADPGKKGAIVLLDGRRVVAVERIADIVGTATWQASHAALCGRLRSLHAEHRVGLAVVELFAGRPGQGAGSAMTIGVGWGILVGCLSGLGIPVLTPSSASWTRTMFEGVSGEGKERGIGVALAHLPDLELRRGKERNNHDGVADAGCLALWGQRHPLGRE